MFDQGTKIGAPSPEIIIDVNYGNSCRFGSPLQSGNAVSQGRNETGQLFRVGEIEIVNYIRKDQGDLRFIGCAAMIGVLTAQRFSWGRVRHRSMAAINKSRLSSRTNAALQIPQKITRTFSLARVF
jgi:hypothetical protein